MKKVNKSRDFIAFLLDRFTSRPHANAKMLQNEEQIIMRKTILFPLLLVALVFSFTSCSLTRPKIEDCEWKMQTIAHIENNCVIYDAVEENSLHPDAKVIDMTLVAKGGKVVITDATNNKTYEGSYTVSGKNPKGTDYIITMDGKTARATVAKTTFADGTKKPTLPITLDGYSMCFYEK